MKSRISKSEEKKRERLKQIFFASFLVLIMFGSVFGIVVNSFGGKKNIQNNINYNGFEFFRNENFWITEKENSYFIFNYLPNETQINIQADIKNLDFYYGKPLYISSEDLEIKSLIYTNFKEIAQRIQDACVINETCKGDYPPKDCSDNFIIIREGNKTFLEQNQSCVYISAPKENLTKIMEEFLYRVLEIK